MFAWGLVEGSSLRCLSVIWVMFVEELFQGFCLPWSSYHSVTQQVSLCIGPYEIYLMYHCISSTFQAWLQNAGLSPMLGWQKSMDFSTQEGFWLGPGRLGFMVKTPPKRHWLDTSTLQLWHLLERMYPDESLGALGMLCNTFSQPWHKAIYVPSWNTLIRKPKQMNSVLFAFA